MLGLIIYLLIVGVIAGFLARLLVPGRDPMSVGATILLGIVGSFIGGFLGYLLFRADGEDGAFQPAGIIGSIIGAVIALLVYRADQPRAAESDRRLTVPESDRGPATQPHSEPGPTLPSAPVTRARHDSRETGSVRRDDSPAEHRGERPPSVDALARSLAGSGLPHPLLVDLARAAIAAGDAGAARRPGPPGSSATLLQPGDQRDRRAAAHQPRPCSARRVEPAGHGARPTSSST